MAAESMLNDFYLFYLVCFEYIAYFLDVQLVYKIKEVRERNNLWWQYILLLLVYFHVY